MYKKFLIVLFITILLVFSGCRKSEQQARESASSPSLTVGMMSAVDAAPFYVALEKGYFKEAGVDVELMLFTNGQNRQTLADRQVMAMTDLAPSSPRQPATSSSSVRFQPTATSLCLQSRALRRSRLFQLEQWRSA